MIETSDSLGITHVISSLEIGGAQQLLLDLSLETRARGQQVRVIALRPGPMAAEFRRQGIPVEELSMTRMCSFPTFFRVVSILRRTRPDLVHTHLGRADSYGRVAALLARVPAIVSTVHNVEKWKDNLALRWIDAGTSRLADHIIACSDRVRAHLQELNLVPMRKVTVIRNGIRLPEHRHSPAAVAGVRRELGLKPGDYGIGVIARLEPQKGHRHLFAAVAALREAIPQLRLVVVGEGSLRASLEQLAQSLQLGSRIVFAGSRRDVPLLNAAMDVIVLPSLWEGLPIALLESMALGRTVIATKVGGVPEVIEHEVNGLLTPPGDALALAAAIQRCWQDRHMAGALASAAFRQVRDKFTIEANAAKVLAVYREQVRGSPEGVPREVPSAGLG